MVSRRIGVGLIAVLGARAASGSEPAPIVYDVRIPAPDTHYAEIVASLPADKKAILELMMPVWSPGFYRVEDYAGRVESLAARASDGQPLVALKTTGNRWRIETQGAPRVSVSYRLLCDQRSVTTNWISSDLGVLNGAAAFVTLAERSRRPHEVRLELPPTWKQAATSLRPARDGRPNHYRAADYETLVDSPIVAGALDAQAFEVAGRRHLLVDVGERPGWDGSRASRDLARMVAAVRQLWGFLPFDRYVFLNVFRQGGGGLEHKDSTLLTANAERAGTPAGYRRWLEFVSHEYFHAFNVKRLRPLELGPFDYEHPPTTDGLWVSEGLTNYYAALMLARAGLIDRDDFLASLSAQIERLQKEPGRLLQTVAQSSLEVWGNSLSGVNPSDKTVSYYIKGHVMGFLLDAKIRRATADMQSLDDVMRLAYKRYAGARGFTAEQFQATAASVAGADLADWFKRAVRSTEELDYDDALAWYGLRFVAATGPPATQWQLAVRADATEAQRSRLAALVAAR